MVIGYSWAYTTRQGTLPAIAGTEAGSWRPLITYPLKANGGVITCIQALPLGTNTNNITAHFWIADPINFGLRLVGTKALGTSTAPSAGSQYTNPSGGVIDCSSILPVTTRPDTKVGPSSPVRMLHIQPGWYFGCSSDNPAGSGGSGWQINFYGGEW